MFSTTTMASSTTNPIANTKASSVSRLMEKPSAPSTMKVERMQTGATIVGMIAARAVPRKTKFTNATSASDIDMVIQTSWIAWRVNCVKSIGTVSVVPFGRVRLISATAL